jgi:hypothetical protein
MPAESPQDKLRREQSASVMQAAVRGRNDRKSAKGQEAQQKVASSKKEAAEKKKKESIAKEAEKAAERQRLAENTFADADVSGDGAIDEKELATLIITLLKKEKLDFDQEAVQEFVKVEFDAADLDNDGKVAAPPPAFTPASSHAPELLGGRLPSHAAHPHSRWTLTSSSSTTTRSWIG